MRPVDCTGRGNSTPHSAARLRLRIGAGGEVFEHIGEAEAALEAALDFRIDFRIHLDDGLRERRRGLDPLRRSARLLGGEGLVLDDGVEPLEIGKGSAIANWRSASPRSTGAPYLIAFGFTGTPP